MEEYSVRKNELTIKIDKNLKLVTDPRRWTAIRLKKLQEKKSWKIVAVTEFESVVSQTVVGPFCQLS